MMKQELYLVLSFKQGYINKVPTKHKKKLQTKNLQLFAFQILDTITNPPYPQS